MASVHYGLPDNSITPSSKNHFEGIHDIVKAEIIKEVPIEIKCFSEYGVCDESRQEEAEDGKFYAPISSNCENSSRESKPSLTYSLKNTNFDMKGSGYIFAADDQEVDQIKKEIKVEYTDEDHFECTDDLLAINADVKIQTLKSEDEIDIDYEDIKPKIHGIKLSGNKSHPNTIAKIVPQESLGDFGAEPQQNTTVEEDETDVERDIQKQFQFNFCSRFFPNSGHLKDHMRIHTGGKPFQCNFCSKSFGQSGMKNHGWTHTGEKPFQCNFCSKSFTQNGTLKCHERTHTGEKPFQCNYCSKTFRRNGTLKTHERTHTGERPFHCKLCKKSFGQSGTLEAHERTHTGEKPFQCNYCSKSFRERGALKIHERTHTGEKPFQCNLCLKSYRQSGAMKIHARTHTGEKPFECNLCPKSFTYSSVLKTHARTHTRKKTFQC